MAGSTASPRPQSSGLRRLAAIALIILCSGGVASAGPWVQDKGDVFARLSYVEEDHDGFGAVRGDIYGEWGLTDRWTLSGKYERVDFETSNVFDSDGWRITGRRKLWSGKTWVTSAEVGLLEGAALGGFRGCESLGMEVAAGLGWSTQSRFGNFYASGTIARRQHSEGCFHDRFEGVFGYTLPSSRILTYQLWSERGETDRSDKMEIMMSQRFGVVEPGIGIRREVSGEFEESALVFAISARF